MLRIRVPNLSKRSGFGFFIPHELHQKRDYQLNLPEIANLELQPLQVPGGWCVSINHFYQLDPDEDLSGHKVLHISPESINDPWDDVLNYYFDYSWLWLATRNDNRYQLAVEWFPMGDRNGQFILEQRHGTPVRFAHPPPRTVKRKRDDIQVQYDLNAPVIWGNQPERHLESRDRGLIAATLDRWLAECSRNWS